MKKLPILFFVLLNAVLFAPKLSAQLKDSYIKGIITLKDGQNINAYIKQQELEKIRKGILYKISLTDSDESVYLHDQIEQVSLETGAIYKTLHCVVPKSKNSVSFLASQLVIGKASLYETSYEKTHVYIVVNNGISYWLQEDEIENGELVRYYYKNILYNSLVNSVVVEQQDIERVRFNGDLIKLITKYNLSSNSVNEVIEVKNKSTSYVIAGIGGMYKDAAHNEYYIQAAYRNYFPWISRSTSLNIGLSYFRNVYKTDIGNYSDITVVRTLYSVPFYMQQNLLNKRIRPYLLGGFNISYITEKNNENNMSVIIKEGLQRNYGLGFLVGAGIEADVLKSFIIKGEYRFENFPHLLMMGIAYKFRL